MVSSQSSATCVNEPWSYASQLQEYRRNLEESNVPTNAGLSVCWDNLSIRGLGGADDVVYAPNLGTILMPWRARQQQKRAQQKILAQRGPEAGVNDPMAWSSEMTKPGKNEDGLRPGQRYLLKDFSGLLHPGEMMLVVGRPGSGCSTFLKALADLTGAYAGVEGDVFYGSLKAGSKEFQPHRSQVVFNSEEDIHDPNLTVGRTLDFAARMVTPGTPGLPAMEDGSHMTARAFQAKTKSDLLAAFHIPHTINTKVGDQYVRGVSGGERKRVSLAEALVTDASVICWDNATRGLDASTALDYARLCRTLCDVGRKVNIISLYQAGNGIYDQFDKLCVIAGDRVIYYGPRQEARGYFEALGFEHMDGANTADYCTAVTALDERKIFAGWDKPVPNTPAEFAQIYQQSDIASRMREEVEDHLRNGSTREEQTKRMVESIQATKSKGSVKSSPQKASYPAQVKAAVVRECQQRWGDQLTFWARQASTFVLAFLIGSIFYSAPQTTGGLYLRGGAIFSTLVFPCILGFADVQAAFTGRAVLAKHKAYSLYRPSAVLIAQTLVDLPVFLFQIVIFTIIVYFMVGLQSDAGLYFAFLLFCFVLYGTFTCLFRAIGYAFATYNDASKVAGMAFTAFTLYSGFVIYTPSMHPWFSWIRWLNPVYYAFESLLTNELDGIVFGCTPPQLAPYGGSYANTGSGPAGCAITGAVPGVASVTGEAYLAAALRFSKPHVWRNLGIILAWWVAYLIAGCLFTESVPMAGSTKGVTLYKAGSSFQRDGPVVEEKETAGLKAERSTTFTWNHLSYTVKADGKDKQLLNDIFGYCKAGTLTALMGSSGAGKTTLMDVLAARKSEGVVTGHVELNGAALPISFQRTTGYCEQLDVHLPQATVREALEFSALLRQPRTSSRAEKLAYVDKIVDLLELHDIENALVGVPGAGLGVEQRKRLTIGVELVSKPTLLFLDEPTSGLDGQSSYKIVSFLKKLAATGQSVLCTIHQPSAALFSGFDNLLLLKGGGNTVYFGAVDQLPAYFAEHDCPFPEATNPAEYMIDVVSGDLSKDKDWAKVWLDSEHRAARLQELEELHGSAAAQQHPDEEDSHEYAAPFSEQMKVVVERAFVQLWRDTEYVMNKFALHISVGLLVGFSYWKIGNSYADLQNRLFAIFNFVFVAPGVMVQTQPKFIANRDIFEKREKKAKLYSWKVFCAAEIIAELPYLVVCAFLFWACWYATVGFSFAAGVVGPVFLEMVLYEFLYTGIAQFIAAYAPNPQVAAMVLPVLIGALINFAGVIIPYSQITEFWRYWMYYLDPFTYLLGALLVFPIWDVQVQCKPEEYGLFDPPSGQTCGQYLDEFLTYATGYLNNPDATTSCEYCGYQNGREYLASLNLSKHIYGWRDICITLLFVISSYSLVFVLLKLRSKKSKIAE